MRHPGRSVRDALAVPDCPGIRVLPPGGRCRLPPRLQGLEGIVSKRLAGLALLLRAVAGLAEVQESGSTGGEA